MTFNSECISRARAQVDIFFADALVAFCVIDIYRTVYIRYDRHRKFRLGTGLFCIVCTVRYLPVNDFVDSEKFHELFLPSVLNNGCSKKKLFSGTTGSMTVINDEFDLFKVKNCVNCHFMRQKVEFGPYK
jgi:hypothetical protein